MKLIETTLIMRLLSFIMGYEFRFFIPSFSFTPNVFSEIFTNNSLRTLFDNLLRGDYPVADQRKDIYLMSIFESENGIKIRDGDGLEVKKLTSRIEYQSSIVDVGIEEFNKIIYSYTSHQELLDNSGDLTLKIPIEPHGIIKQVAKIEDVDPNYVMDWFEFKAPLQAPNSKKNKKGKNPRIVLELSKIKIDDFPSSLPNELSEYYTICIESKGKQISLVDFQRFISESVNFNGFSPNAQPQILTRDFTKDSLLKTTEITLHSIIRDSSLSSPNKLNPFLFINKPEALNFLFHDTSIASQAFVLPEAIETQFTVGHSHVASTGQGPHPFIIIGGYPTFTVFVSTLKKYNKLIPSCINCSDSDRV